jgi:2-dehydropantoate 2-reductase
VSSAGKTLLATTLDQFQKMGFECRFIDEEPTLMWSKAVFLAPIALATTAFDQPIGGVLGSPERKTQWEACVREACAVATAEGAKVDPNAVLSGMSRMPPAMRSSMQKDVEQGNPPELDAIAGPILRGGAHRSIPVHATERLAAAVERRSRGR